MPNALIIEDDLFFSVRIEKTLQKMGYTVNVATTTQQAVTQSETAPPDLIILNFGNERMDAAATVEHLKTAHPAARVLGHVSHVNMAFVRPNAMRAGCDLLVANSALTMRLPQLVEKLLAGKTDAAPETVTQ